MKLDLDYEVKRLAKHAKVDLDIDNMDRGQKLDFLQAGIRFGWYGSPDVQKAILGDLYGEIKERMVMRNV